ncbi:MAG: 50S ribosomal protein L15 [Rhabdochlamydiaceae bacterium]|jgi:large subunit ribosomal protein L15
MMTLSQLTNTHRPHKKAYRVGRGMGSKCGKTCGRGNKGDKARCGYKTRPGHEGGQIPLYKKSPTRGFSNAKFANTVFAINLGMIEKLYSDGETVTLKNLQEKGYAPRRIPGGLKILSGGELKKKVSIEACQFSAAAEEKLKKNGISFQQVPVGK